MMISMNKVKMLVISAALLACCFDQAFGRQYNQIQNQLLTPSESTGEEVLKELGVDLKNEGRTDLLLAIRAGQTFLGHFLDHLHEFYR